MLDGRRPPGLIKTFGDVEKSGGQEASARPRTASRKLPSDPHQGRRRRRPVRDSSTALGLTSAIKDFEDTDPAAADKLDTAVKGMGSHIDTAKIKDLAFQLQQRRRSSPMTRWWPPPGGVRSTGLTTDQLSQLLKVAVDLSTQTGQSARQGHQAARQRGDRCSSDKMRSRSGARPVRRDRPQGERLRRDDEGGGGLLWWCRRQVGRLLFSGQPRSPGFTTTSTTSSPRSAPGPTRSSSRSSAVPPTWPPAVAGQVEPRRLLTRPSVTSPPSGQLG